MPGRNSKKSREVFALYIRNFIFGVEDSLVSTVGLLAGIATAGVSKSVILVSGIVLIFVEAFSMGVGSLLSEHSAQEYLQKLKINRATVLVAGFIMFISYFLTGFIPLAPYLVWLPSIAMPVSIVLSLCTLFVLGVVSAKLFKTNVWHKALEMLIIGGGAIIIGVVVGGWVDGFLS